MNKLFLCLVLAWLPLAGVHAQSLSEYQQTAAEENPGLKAEYKLYEAALERIPQVKSLEDPVFSFGYFISPVETRTGPQRARFSLTQMFPWFRTLKARGDAATLAAEAKFHSFIDRRNKLFYRTAAAYYPLYELNRLKQLEKENIEILQSYKTIANKRFESGSGSMTDVLRADIMLQDAQTNLDILQAEEKPLKADFNNLLNKDENSEVIIDDSLTAEPPEQGLNKDTLLADNPVLEELDLKIKSQKAAEQAATKQGLPKMGVGLDYILIGERDDMQVPDNGKNALMPMVSVSIPIFRARYRSAVKEAQRLQESYALQKEDYSNSLSSSYERAQFKLMQQRRLIALYDRQIEEARQALNLLTTAYSNSGKEFEEVLRMQQQLIKYQKQKAGAVTEYHIAKAELEYITADSK